MMRACVAVIVGCVGLLHGCGGDSAADTSKSDQSQQQAGSRSTKAGTACGSHMCSAPEGSVACCADRFSGACGVMMAGTCRMAVQSDERCPVPDLKLLLPADGSIQRPIGCCTADNECGVDFGVGCQSRTVLCMGIGLDQLDKLKAETCDHKPLPLPPDCGTRMVVLPGVAGQSGGS